MLAPLWAGSRYSMPTWAQGLKSYLEGQADLVGRIIMGIIRATSWVIGFRDYQPTYYFPLAVQVGAQEACLQFWETSKGPMRAVPTFSYGTPSAGHNVVFFCVRV